MCSISHRADLELDCKSEKEISSQGLDVRQDVLMEHHHLVHTARLEQLCLGFFCFIFDGIEHLDCRLHVGGSRFFPRQETECYWRLELISHFLF